MAKTKALISFAVTAKLICVFVFAYAKSRFSHDAAHMVLDITQISAGRQMVIEDLLSYMYIAATIHLSLVIA